MVSQTQEAVFAHELHWISEPETPEEIAVRNDASQALDIIRQRFGRIADSIGQFWGSEAFDGYIEKLLIDERGGRQGFPPQVAEALLRLSRLHVERFGYGAVNDVWVWRERHID